MHWKRWNWLDGGVLPLLVAILRACWLWPWMGLAQRILAPSYQGTLLPVGVVVGLPLVSLTLGRRILSKTWGQTEVPWRPRVGLAVAGLAAILLVLWWQFYRIHDALWDLGWLGSLGFELTHWGKDLPAPWLALLVAVYLWLRGVWDGSGSLQHDDIWGAFAVGILALVLYFVAVTTGVMALPPGMGNLVLIFFGVGMAALAFANLKIAGGLSSTLGAGTRQIGMKVQVNRYWLLSVALVILALLALGLLLGFLVAPQDVARLLDWASSLLRVVGRLFSYVLLAISYVLAAIFYALYLLLRPLIVWLRSMMAAPQEREPLETPEPFGEQWKDMPVDPATIPEPFRWLGLAVFVVMVLLIFALGLRRLQSQAGDGVEETRESVFSADLLQDQLSSLWRRWWDRLRSASSATWAPFLSLDGEVPTRRAIRTVYQRLLATATEQGQPRQRSQTPLEYQRQLARRLSEEDELLTTITGAYMEARYGLHPPAEEAAARVQAAWKMLQSRLDRQDDEENEA